MIYSIDSGAITVAAAHVTKSAIGTVKFINGFYNPSTSGVNAIIRRAVVSMVSGTPAGPLLWNFYSGITAASVTSSPTGTIQSALLNSNTSGLQSAMLAEVNVAFVVTGNTNAAIQSGVIGGAASTATGVGIYTVVDEYALPDFGSAGFDYYMIVPPGTVIGITAAAVGTSQIYQSTIYWQEFPA